MKNKPISIAQVGLGGYGSFYLNLLMGENRISGGKLVAAVDPVPEGCGCLEELKSEGIPIYPDLDSLFAERSVDLVIVVAPIQFHKPFTIKALEKGCAVLCEKPVAGTIQELHDMIAARDRFGKAVGIGYQFSFAPGNRKLKQDVLDGKYGKPIRMKSMVFWPRPDAYFKRNKWAGAQKASNGAVILDSPVNNATAHFLHNMFYVLGDKPETAVRPTAVEAELYRVNPIENYDTAALRVMTECDVEVLFYTTHATEENHLPMFSFEFENGKIECLDESGNMVGTLNDGTTVEYGRINADDEYKLLAMIDAVSENAPIVCGLETAASQTIAMNGAQLSQPDIQEFPEEMIHCKEFPNGNKLRWIDGLEEAFRSCFQQNKLPHELNLPWSKAGKRVDLTNFTRLEM